MSDHFDGERSQHLSTIQNDGPPGSPGLFDEAAAREAVRALLLATGENPDRPGLRETPRRVAASFRELLAGMGRDPADEINVFFEVGHDEMVIVRDIAFASMCEHHLLPFIGKAHVAYIPRNGRITGLSKIARVVDIAARRPQLQERLTGQIADAIMNRLNCRGVLVVMEAEHLCMTIRGVKQAGSSTLTSALRGAFRNDPKTRSEAMAVIRNGR